jgi:pantoate--beta-alanine ligase
MKLITDLNAMRSLSRLWGPDSSVGFVPTMGYLHAGHLSLVEQSNQRCAITVVSIFVNPAQFGPSEDLDSYPRDLERDLAMLERYRVDYVFFPTPELMYPPAYKTWIEVEGISSVLCGASRPGHFRGVATVVAKLVNIVNPDFMFMGEKDYQQCLVLESMLRDLNFRTRIVRCPIIREKDGLAMSSRNKYLDRYERRNALCLYKSLQLAKDLYSKGDTDPELLQVAMTNLILKAGGKIDYIAFVHKDTLAPQTVVSKETRILLAVFIGKTRLIDNSSL